MIRVYTVTPSRRALTPIRRGREEGAMIRVISKTWKAKTHIFFFGTPIRGVKIEPPELKSRYLEAKFHVDSVFHGPRAIGGQKRGVIRGQRCNMKEVDQRRTPNFDPSEQRSKSNLQS